MRTAVNLNIDRYRHHQRTLRLLPSLVEDDHMAAPPLPIDPHMLDALRALPERQRQVIALQALLGLSGEQTTWGCRAGTDGHPVTAWFVGGPGRRAHSPHPGRPGDSGRGLRCAPGSRTRCAGIVARRQSPGRRPVRDPGTAPGVPESLPPLAVLDIRGDGPLAIDQDPHLLGWW